mmetsp:Transcript_22378/g.33061  ORF Transcript_22378/g.33061 Transcript_22378/m.33061 type:complete len:902 (+) Transcript_22378:101-2806(+)|eukprot:CAMPEP_0194211414 /NCGR_PEP_ID=MMETSP0156-20130528/10224_1 /TAXON_ID=33649 /ORGANISM="Thalassionema nitzschioides, Strain L26-B" /LENGTH=901 /DNA_ID=CAMNT_0038938947 /DNA_START=38 /DNA_END=2743 /DNA_ORIENTATION=-
MTSQVDEELEEFKTCLVNDVFGSDNQGKIPMEKVVMLIWQFRDDPNVVKFMAQFVAKFAGSRDVFAGVEFYLPQLAHMIIHLDVDWDEAILERFALVVAQQSLHFALQLNWILQGSIQDYEPELPSGEPNPGYHPLYYNRCIILLKNIERVAVYGRPRSLELQRLYESGKITKQELDILELHDRRFNAVQIQEVSAASSGREKSEVALFGGELLYKRKVRTSCLKPKPWKTRYFCIQNTMLHCYNKQGGKLVRSMPLESAQIGDVEKGKYRHMFFVENQGFHFTMRAGSSVEKQRWVTKLKEEAKALSLFSQTEEFLEDLSPTQRARFEFFRNERIFCRNLCDLAEELRFKDPDERKASAPTLVAEMAIPPCVYVPLCNSMDIWRRVDEAIPATVKVFNTKERCPVMMHFVCRRGEFEPGKDHPGLNNVNLDVAEYLHLTFDVADQNKTEVEEQEEGMKPIEEENLNPEVVESEECLENNSGSAHASLWHDGNHEDDGGSGRNPQDSERGNKQVQSFLKNNLIMMPKKLANRIPVRRLAKQKSVFGRSSVLEAVPIIGEEKRSIVEDDEESVVSVEVSSAITNRKSLMAKPGTLIEREHLAAATKIICGTTWAQRTAQMLESYTEGEGVAEISSVFAKSNDDLRQEVFVMQMIHYYKSVFAKGKVDVWLKTYKLLSLSRDTGMIECINDATSLDGLKKSPDYPKEGGLRAYFEQVYGSPSGPSFQEAQRNFMKSLAGYSLVSYLLGLKDRHNGNIMISNLGHLIHIDFGFAMGMAPGHEFSFERAHFKLTKEYVELLNGWNSPLFQEFRKLFVTGFLQARKNSLIALGMVEIMMYESNYPCFTGTRYGNGVSLKRFENRLMLHIPDDQVQRRAEKLIDQAYNHGGTNLYDKFQNWSNGYAI